MLFSEETIRENTVQVERLSHSLFEKTLSGIHKGRLKSLLACASGLVRGNRLSITGIGRCILGQAKVRHKIKRVDRLASNKHLYYDKNSIYKEINKFFFKGMKRLILLVDWTPFKHDRDYGVLRVTVVFNKCAITVYQEVSKYNDLINIKHQKRFLEQLKSCLPEAKQVIVISDMGFLSDWFRLVESMGWDYLGRIRSDCKYSQEGKEWFLLGLSTATSVAKRIKNCYVFRTKPLKTNLILFRKRKKKSKRKESNNPTIKQYQKSARLPWYLVTSLDFPAEIICNLYSKRMKIEATFRDIKSYRFGMGLNLSIQYTKSLIRREILLLIVHIAYCLLLLIGWVADKKDWLYDFQVNSKKNKRGLSLISLGRQVIQHYLNKLKIRDIKAVPLDLEQNITSIFNEWQFSGDA
jgi:hypothetical protein